MVTGVVKEYYPEKNSGTITGEDGSEYFVHHSALQSEGVWKLEAEQVVTFTAKIGNRGHEAVMVRVV